MDPIDPVRKPVSQPASQPIHPASLAVRTFWLKLRGTPTLGLAGAWGEGTPCLWQMPGASSSGAPANRATSGEPVELRTSMRVWSRDLRELGITIAPRAGRLLRMMAVLQCASVFSSCLPRCFRPGAKALVANSSPRCSARGDEANSLAMEEFRPTAVRMKKQNSTVPHEASSLTLHQVDPGIYVPPAAV